MVKKKRKEEAHRLVGKRRVFTILLYPKVQFWLLSEISGISEILAQGNSIKLLDFNSEVLLYFRGFEGDWVPHPDSIIEGHVVGQKTLQSRES